MAKFINYRNLSFSLNGEKYYASKVSLSAKSSPTAVLLNDGSLLDYAPENSLVGNLSVDFYLTGSFPSYINITGLNESAISGVFAGVSITGLYPKDISFSVEPFQPIVINANFDWYGNVNVQSFNENTQSDINNFEIPNYIANAYKSFINTNNLDGINNVISFDYSASCDRPSFFYVDDKLPFRVAKLNRRCNISLKSNILGDLIDIDGKSVNSVITLRDSYGTILDTFPISGVLTDQSYDVTNGQYMIATANISQTIADKKTLI